MSAPVVRARRGVPMGEADAEVLKGRMLAMIFEKPSTRTRVSFDMAMRQLGGQTMFLASSDMQTDRGAVGDTARVLSRYVDAIMYRTFGEDRLNELVTHASVPVINGLTDRSHPCQIMADILTFEEKLGPVAGQVIAWCGDSSNVTVVDPCRRSLRLRAADREPRAAAARQGGDRLGGGQWRQRHGDRGSGCGSQGCALCHHRYLVLDEREAAGGQAQPADAVSGEYRLMKSARPDAIFMHCLPVHRGEEVTAIIDGPRSVVFEEAENRLHAQKGILAWCLGASVRAWFPASGRFRTGRG